MSRSYRNGFVRGFGDDRAAEVEHEDAIALARELSAIRQPVAETTAALVRDHDTTAGACRPNDHADETRPVGRSQGDGSATLGLRHAPVLGRHERLEPHVRERDLRELPRPTGSADPPGGSPTILARVKRSTSAAKLPAAENVVRLVSSTGRVCLFTSLPASTSRRGAYFWLLPPPF